MIEWEGAPLPIHYGTNWFQMTAPVQDGSGQIQKYFGFTFVQWEEVETQYPSLVQSMV